MFNLDYQTLPVTVRSLETLIRLSTAHAKARLSQTVEKVFSGVVAVLGDLLTGRQRLQEDAEKAQEIVKFMLFHEVQKSSRKRRKTAHNEGNDSSDEEDDDDEDDEPKPAVTPR
jgi:DNA replication licensing factor MCM3